MIVDYPKLRALSESATPGPWEPQRMLGAHPDVDAQYIVATDGDEQIADCNDNTRWSHAQTTANAAFISAANPTAVLSLIDEIERLRTALAEALDLFDANWCPEHGHAPTAEAFACATKLRKLVQPDFTGGQYP